MRVLVTGANGYIGKRLIPLLLEGGHEVYCLVREKKRFPPLVPPDYLIEADLLDPASLDKIPSEIDAAYYLVHSMSSSSKKFYELEEASARHFASRLAKTQAQQIIYLSGLSHEQELSRHLASRKNVERVLREGSVPVTVLKAGIIIGSGSASFEIIRDLVEKLPFMVAPRWLNQKTQPIAVHDVLHYLTLVLGHLACRNRTFEIGGPDLFTYKELLLRFAKLRGLKRTILTLPLLTPKLSSYWLYFVTSASFPLVRSLVESLKNEAVCTEHSIRDLFPFPLLSFDEAVTRAFQRIEERKVVSSWKDAWGEGRLNPHLEAYLEVPTFGCLIDRSTALIQIDPEKVKKNIWTLGGKRGWRVFDWAWEIRGLIDQLFGGVGLRRGRRDPEKLIPGDALDFWRVLVADEERGRLLLYAEMKLPGEAWLEFQIEGNQLIQTATFRPKGVLGRLYWYLLYPIHLFLFRSLVRSLVNLG